MPLGCFLTEKSQIRTPRIQRRVPIRAKELKKRMGGQLFETREA
jgi:hypothetical protein